MYMNLKIMEQVHIKKIAQLEKLCFSSAWSENALSEELENPNAKFLVALESDELLGYAGMHIVLGEGFVTNIAVFQNHRKKGVATKLIEELIASCEISLSLEVRESNFIAISLYEKMNFKKMGERKNFYQNPQENALIYTLYKN